MAREKRTKPCGHCKKSKLRCEYTDALPCVRCIKNGLADSCQFVIRLPSLSFPMMGNVPMDRKEPPAILPFPQARGPETPKPRISPAALMPPQPVPGAVHEQAWRSNMESKLSSVDSKFNDLLSALQENQRALVAERALNQRYVAENRSLLEQASRHDLLQRPGSAKRQLLGAGHEQTAKRMAVLLDFRDTVLSKDEAHVLFEFFDANISKQLFGFEIRRFSVDVLWQTSPILICAICTIALMHYPDRAISDKQELLKAHLNALCLGLLFLGRPRNDMEGFNAIVALVLCSFWLSDLQMFTGLAIQLANDFRLNDPNNRNDKSSLSNKDRLKLWYLLYILDGQQSMTFNRRAIVSTEDYAIKNSRQLFRVDKNRLASSHIPLISSESKSSDQTSDPEIGSLTDLRLVSQVEYNVALSESLKGNAWDLLTPQALGIPSKSNLELDKWMVSWTVLLAPTNNGAVWLSKSTLIYYNFAKMHINSSVMRQLQVESGSESLILPNWQNYRPQSNPVFKEEAQENSSDEESEDDEFLSNSELDNQDQALVDFQLAVNAAQTVLNLVLSDSDILSNLRYAPVHVHIMLYYAAILLVSPPPSSNSAENGSGHQAYFADILLRLKVVKILQRKIGSNLPTDRSFGNQLLKNLDTLFDERLLKLKEELSGAALHVSEKARRINEISTMQFSSSQLEMVLDSLENSSKEASPKPEKISAWPGSNHGHP